MRAKFGSDSPVEAHAGKSIQEMQMIKERHPPQMSAEVYYCTVLGRVYGELKIFEDQIVFEPQYCHENTKFMKPKVVESHSHPHSFWCCFATKAAQSDTVKKQSLKKFEVAIDIGDVASCQLRKFYNETGQFIADSED